MKETTSKKLGEIGNRMRIAREELGLSQSKISELFGCSVRTYQKNETGLNEAGVSIADDFIQLGINANWLLTGEGPMILGDLLSNARNLRDVGATEESWWRIIQETIKVIPNANYWFISAPGDPIDPLVGFVDKYNSNEVLVDAELRKRIPVISLGELKEFGRSATAWLDRLKNSLEAPAKSLFDGFVLVPRYDVSASMGTGSVIHSEQVVDHLAFREEWVRTELGAVPKNLILISAIGDSMEPTLRAGDLLLIDRSGDGVKQDAIYAFATNGELRVKRMQLKMDGSVVVKSDNQQYEPETLTSDQAATLHIVGRVVWSGRRM